MNPEVQATLIGIAAATLGAVLRIWFIVEHRLTVVETRLDVHEHQSAVLAHRH
jgi:hypothetical protein